MAGADPKKSNSPSAKATGIDSQLPPPEKLPPSLQKIIDKADKEDNFYDELWEGT
jgi:mitochondrial fission process protein 1